MEFSVLLQENRSAVERFVRFRIGNLHDAEDVLSDVYTAAFVGFGTLSNADAFKPWIIGIARNKCNDYFRRQSWLQRRKARTPNRGSANAKRPANGHAAFTSRFGAN